MVVAIFVRPSPGAAMRSVREAEFAVGSGMRGCADAGDAPGEVRILADETAGAAVAPGDLGENLRVRGIDLGLATVGSTIRVGTSVLLEIVRRPIAHEPCVVARVLSGGSVRPGDEMAYDTLIV